jgi:hypothetical protein
VDAVSLFSLSAAPISSPFAMGTSSNSSGAYNCSSVAYDAARFDKELLSVATTESRK